MADFIYAEDSGSRPTTYQVPTLVGAFDWSQTPLGSRESWPQSLQTATDLVLNCQFPMILLWGSSLVQIYNNGYSIIMGKKHPAGLGQPTRECWPEVWHLNEPIYARVWAGEALTFEDQLYPITRHGYLEEAYFTLCYSPVRDESGQVGGVLVTVFETTDRLRAEQSLGHSEERLKQVFDQAPVGVCVLRGRDFVYELVNSSYREFLPNRAILGRPLREVIPELDARLIAILDRVFDTGEAFVAHEFFVPLDRDGDGVAEDFWFTFVYQPLRELNETISGIVVIATDVTSHVRARLDLERANQGLEEFAYIASHDLQEPLRMVTAYSQLLAKRFGPESTEEQRDFVGFIQQGTKRMDQLLQDLLT